MRRGRILLITDGMTEDDAREIAARLAGGQRSLAILGVGTSVGAPGFPPPVFNPGGRQ